MSISHEGITQEDQRDIVKEFRQWFHSIATDEIKLVNEYLRCFVGNRGRRERRRFIRKEVPVIGRRKLSL